MKDWAAVQKVYKQTKSKHETAKGLGIARNTVRKLLELSEPPEYRRTMYKSKIDNPKALVIDNNPKSEKEAKYNPHALMMAKHTTTKRIPNQHYLLEEKQ